MNSIQFRAIRRSHVFVKTNVPSMKSLTDPSFAMTGLELVMAASSGRPIPKAPDMVYSLGNDVVQNFYADRFDRISQARAQLGDVRSKVAKAHKDFKNSQKTD